MLIFLLCSSSESYDVSRRGMDRDESGLFGVIESKEEVCWRGEARDLGKVVDLSWSEEVDVGGLPGGEVGEVT